MEKDNFNRSYILNLIEVHEGLTISQLVSLAPVSRPAVYDHLELLEKQGLIKRSKDKKKKGAPVTITAIQKEVEKKDRVELIEFLNKINKDEGVDMKELKDAFRSKAYLTAGLRGFTSKKVYLTDKGKEFLKTEVVSKENG